MLCQCARANFQREVKRFPLLLKKEKESLNKKLPQNAAKKDLEQLYMPIRTTITLIGIS